MNLFELYGTILIDATAAGEVISQTMTKVKTLGDSLGGVGDKADGTSEKLKEGSKFSSGCVWLGNTLTTLSEKAGKLVWDLGRIGFGFNTGMESYQYSFEALLGDADKAKQLIADLQELAKISPLGMEGLANNAVTLLTTGTELADILPTLEMLGNLSLGDAEKMNSVVKAYSQILGKGGLMAQEMYQLSDAMVPIIEIMTKYGGERYADGSWYQQKMADPTFKIPAEDMVKAFQAATAEGGKWNDYMLTIMDSFAGQADRLGEEGKETLGAFFQPFFDVAKSDVLPNLITLLGEFRTWTDENKDSIREFAETLGALAVEGFDKALSFFSWAVENKEAVTAAFGAITLAVGGLVATTHPWLTAISAILAGLVEVASLQQEINEYETKYNIAEPSIGNAIEASKNASKTPFEIIRTLNETEATVEVGAELQEGTENNLQTELDGQNLSVDVKVNPIWSAFLNFNKKLGIIGGEEPAHGSHADGLDYVPFDNYRAILHRGEAVLTANEARDWRGGQSNGELASTVAAAVRDAVAGIQFNVSLDGGALIGQLTPTIDRHLGTLANRKGRG